MAAPFTDIVERTSNEFLASAGFSQDQHRCVGLCDRFHLFEYAFETRVFYHDLIKAVLGAEFFFEIALLLGQLSRSIRNPPEGVSMVDCNGYLCCAPQQHV